MTAAILLGPPIDAAMLHGAIAGQLEPVRLDRARDAALARSLFERVRRSADAHRALLTVRREDGDWASAAPGVAMRALRSDARMRIELVRLDADAVARWRGDSLAQELFVLQGELALEGEGCAPALLPRHGHCVRAAGAPGRWRAVGAQAVVYVRHRLADLGALNAGEARWWAAAQAAPPRPGITPATTWWPIAEGVDVAMLFAKGAVVSMLVRVAPGAAIPGHAHALDEDCLMLEGDLFLGDILVRTGDFQMAPAGVHHAGSVSDDGALFYVHGALPGPT